MPNFRTNPIQTNKIFEKPQGFIPQQLNGFDNGPLISEMPDCVDGSKARIQLIDGITLTEQHSLAILRLDSAAECLHVCKMNAVRIFYFIYFTIAK